MHPTGVCEDGLRHEPDVCSCTHGGRRTGYNEEHALTGPLLNPCLSGTSSSSDAHSPTDCNGCCVFQAEEGTFGPRRSRHYIRVSAQLRACLVDLVHSIPHTDNPGPKRRRSTRATAAGIGPEAGPQPKASGPVKKSREENKQEAKLMAAKLAGLAAKSVDRRLLEAKAKGKGKGKGKGKAEGAKPAEVVDDSVDGIA